MKLYFTIYRTTGNNFYFKRKTAAGALLLTGNRRSSRSGCVNDIAVLRLNAGRFAAYERQMTLSTCFQFVIKDLEGVIIAKSEAFSSDQSRDKAMGIVRSLARKALLNDMT
jgi:uncharacterized protein YegP (UPF0339 family)